MNKDTIRTFDNVPLYGYFIAEDGLRYKKISFDRGWQYPNNIKTFQPSHTCKKVPPEEIAENLKAQIANESLGGTKHSNLLMVAAVSALNALTPEDRVGVFAKFCIHCGSDNPACLCSRDE